MGVKDYVIDRAENYLLTPQGLVVGLVSGIVGIVLLLVFGGLTLQGLLSNMLNPLMWIAAIFISAVFMPNQKTILVWSVLFGLLFFFVYSFSGIQTVQAICGVPILGALACPIVAAGSLFVFLFDIAVKTVTGFVMIFITTFILGQLLGQRGR